MRGQPSPDGSERWSANGYHYTKQNGQWYLTHHIIAEKILGRKLEPDERATFKDGKRSNLNPENIEVKDKARGSLRRRKAQLEARINELQAELDEIIAELAKV